MLGGLFGDPEAQALWAADAQVAHYRAFEAALARACAAEGLIPAGLGTRAAKHIMETPVGPASLCKRSTKDGVPIPAFVAYLRATAPDCADGIHPGATSQDVMDTALALTIQATTDLLLTRLRAPIAALAALAEAHGSTLLMARTRMQAALPITVGDRIASWRAPLVSAMTGLAEAGEHATRLQLGGAVGTRHAFDGKGIAVAKRMATELGLSEDGVWHSDRSRIASFAGQLSLVTGALGKMGQDIALMAQQGVDEISLSGGGGSSAMPHKSNPVLAELLVTLAQFNATQLSGLHRGLIHEQERSGTAWMLEWMMLPQMAIATARATNAALDLCHQIIGIGQRET